MGITLKSEGTMQEKLVHIYNWEGEGGARVKKENPYFMMIRTIYHYHHLGKMFRKNHLHGHGLWNVNQWMPLAVELYQKMLVS